MDRRSLQRESLKALFRPLLRWPADPPSREGFSIVLGVPWVLRHLLRVNLDFVARADLRGLDRVRVVFDRARQPEGAALEAEIRAAFPDLPLSFRFHPALAGAIARRIDQSKFYACLNWVLGIADARTRYVVLHDFDLYPVDAGYFQGIVAALAERRWRFSGAEHTLYDGLTEGDGLIGTWSLGIDAAWLRSTHRPIDCFHKIADVSGRAVDLDGFSWLQSLTPERGLAPGLGRESFAHVKNLCSTHLRLLKGEAPKVVWRLHYLWYLEWLAGSDARLRQASEAMRGASGPRLTVDHYTADFSTAHVSCANVLQSELEQMERFVHGGVRAEIAEYVQRFREFLTAHGDTAPLPSAGS